ANAWHLTTTFELATATPGSGFFLPADGATDIAVCYWSPGGMTTTPPDPTGCEIGGNLSLETLVSVNERVPAGVAGGNTNPYSGSRLSANVFDNLPRTQAYRNIVAFRDPILQQIFKLQPVFSSPQAAARSINMDSTASLTTLI